MGITTSPPDPRAMSTGERAAFVLLPLTAFLALAWVLLSSELPLSGSLEWIPALGVRLAWRIDGLAAVMLLMITGVGTAVFVYAGGYLAGHPGQRRLFVLLSLFMVAMIGCVTADDIFVLFLFWEATSVLSFLLVGFDHEKAASRKSAQQALLITGTGGLCLLAGLILLQQAFGTSSLTGIVEQLSTPVMSPTLVAALALVVLGAFTKSAQFPFHFWLPNAMAAPTPVSAYLHSATMVKLGVYLLARFDAGLDESALWQATLQGVGSVTAAWSMLLALQERDLKRILAWSTVATLGTLVALVGLPGESAAVAVGALLMAHALYKAPLFFVAGNIDHGTGTRVIDRLGNLRRAMPWTAAAALLAGVSMAGIPLSFGYVAKDLIATAKSVDDVLAFAPLAHAAFSALAVAVAGVAAIRVFWRHPGHNETPDAHEGNAAMVLPPLLLATVGLVLGLFPFYAQPLVEGVGVAMTPGTEPVLAPLELVIGAELLAYATTFGIGAAVFLAWDPLHRVVDAVSARLAAFGFAAHYERALSAIPHVAAGLTRWLQHGRSPGYLATAVAVSIAALSAALLASARALSWPAWESIGTASAGMLGASAIVAAGAVAAAVLRDRLVLLLGAGLVGYGSAIVFVFAGAPDVAFTQLVVETAFVVVIAAVLLSLRRQGRERSVDEPTLRPLALVLSLGFATALTALLLAAVGGTFDPTLSEWLASESVPAAQGRNVVNVILVDFRALDTLGEISVVMLSLLAAMPLLQRARRRSRPTDGEPS